MQVAQLVLIHVLDGDRLGVGAVNHFWKQGAVLRRSLSGTSNLSSHDALPRLRIDPLIGFELLKEILAEQRALRAEIQALGRGRERVDHARLVAALAKHVCHAKHQRFEVWRFRRHPVL
jgi:hypothetical protein